MTTLSDDTKAFAASVAALAVVSLAGSVYDLPFVLRSAAAVAAGFVALGVASYLLTGDPVAALEEE